MSERDITAYLRSRTIPEEILIVIAVITATTIVIPIIMIFLIKRMREEAQGVGDCLRSGLVAQGVIKDISQQHVSSKKSRKYHPTYQYQALVEYMYEGEVYEIWSDNRTDLNFQIGDVVNVYLHPAEVGRAHVYLPTVNKMPGMSIKR
jgi:hypothetical protein